MPPGSAVRKPPLGTSGEALIYDVPYEYVAMPRDVDRIAAAYGHSAVTLCCIVIGETISKRRKKGTAAPEWCELAETQIAERLGVTDRQVRSLIQKLSGCFGETEVDGNKVPLGFLKVSKNGRGLRLAVNIEQVPKLSTLKARPPKQLSKESERKPAPASAPPIPIELTCPLAQNCPVSEVYETESGGLTNIRENGHTGTPVPVSVSPSAPRETGTPVPVSAPSQGRHRNSSSGIKDRLAELHQAIDVVCAAALRKVPDDPFLRRVLEQLGDAPIADFAAKLQQQQQKLAKYGSGLLPRLAEEVRQAHQVVKRAEAAAPKPVNREVDRAANRETAKRILEDPASTPAEREWAVSNYPDLEPREAARQEAARLLAGLQDGFAGKPLPKKVAEESEARLASIDQQFPGLVSEVRSSRARK